MCDVDCTCFHLKQGTLLEIIYVIKMKIPSNYSRRHWIRKVLECIIYRVSMPFEQGHSTLYIIQLLKLHGLY